MVAPRVRVAHSIRWYTGGVTAVTNLLSVLVGLLTGILSGFGIGGGSLLLLYLTLVAGLPQYQAGGLNLLYFLACAPAALISHIQHHLVRWDAVKWSVFAGIPMSILAARAAATIRTDWLRRAFGVFLLYVGIRELTAKRKRPSSDEKNPLSAGTKPT